MSTTEWMPSLIIAELPVMNPAMNLMIAIARLPMIAATTAFLDSAAMGAVYCTRRRYRVFTRRTEHGFWGMNYIVAS